MLTSARITFKKPRLDELNTNKYSYVDMHLHSKFSDCYLKIQNIVRKAENNKLGIAITDHNDIRGLLDANEIKNKNTILIPGIELSCSEGPHILIYFYSLSDLVNFYLKYVKPNKNIVPNMALSASTEYLITNARKYNCIIGPAHPFGLPRYQIKKHIEKGRLNKNIISQFDFIEVICGQNLRHMNLKAVDWTKELKKGITGGSDGHVLKAMGSVLTYSKANDLDSFLDEIKNKNSFVIGKEMNLPGRVLPVSKQFSKSYLRHPIKAVKSQYKVSVKSHIDKLKHKVKNGIK